MRPCQGSSFARFTLAIFAALVCFLVGIRAHAVTVTVSATNVGTIPEIVGYNSGHFMANSNTADWWRYSGVNGARVWPTPTIVEGSDDGGGWGDGVNSEATFVTRRAALRSNPLSTTYINWPHFENRYQNNPTTGANIINLNHAFSNLHAMSIDPLVVMNRTNNGYPWDPAGTAAGWADRWEHWQHYYAQAFYLAKNFDVHRFQMYNEPNLDDDLAVPEYLERLRFASDAVQVAVADVNQLYGKSLDAQMQGPVTNAPRAEGVVAVHNEWGAPVMQNIHTNYLGQNDPNFRLIDTYAYQQYSISGPTFGSEFNTIKSMVNVSAGNEPIRFALTEFNVWSAAAFENRPNETLDMPLTFASLGSILTNLTKNQPHELYLFKFSQTADDSPSGVKKNGFHYVDNGNAPYNIGGVTKGGEVVRLFTKGFAGANELFSGPTTAGSGASDLQLVASHSAEQNRYYLLSTNQATSARSLTVDLNSWGIEPGTRVIVEEVSADRQGEVTHVLTVPQSRLLSLPGGGQAAQSVMLFSIPKFKSAYHFTLDATDDAMVKAGANAAANFGDSPNLFAKNEPVDPAARNVSFIKFNTGSIAASTVEQAILQVHGANAGSASQVIAHVYGLTNDAWDEATVNWNNAPNLADSSGAALDDISENFIEGIGTSASFVGHFTGIATERDMAIDVTCFVQEHPDQEITFLIAREVRFDGENVDDDFTSLQLASKENGIDPGPQLLLSLSAAALPGDYDRNGIVDAGDYDIWRDAYGSTNSAADGDRSGAVDASDYLVWRKNFGANLPGTVDASGNGATVPELASTAHVGLAILAFARRAPRIGARRASKGIVRRRVCPCLRGGLNWHGCSRSS